jgi:hypothetical protein
MVGKKIERRIKVTFPISDPLLFTLKSKRVSQVINATGEEDGAPSVRGRGA